MATLRPPMLYAFEHWPTHARPRSITPLLLLFHPYTSHHTSSHHISIAPYSHPYTLSDNNQAGPRYDPHTNMTAIQRPRDILGALPLSLFYPDPNTLPSPISLPARAGPSFTSASSSTSTSTLASTPTSSEKRKRTHHESDVPDTVKRLRSRCTVTPKERAFMERDELGTGRSPARRLFVNDLDGASCVHTLHTPNNANARRGISGAVSSGPSSPLCQPSPKASSSRPQRTSSLAPSPPISTSNTPRSTPRRRDVSLPDGEASVGTPTSKRPESAGETIDDNVHDIGFSIYNDAESSTTRHRSLSASARLCAETASPAGSLSGDPAADVEEDKENVRPTAVAALSVPYLASPGPSRPRSRLRESAINLDHDSPFSSPKGTPKKSGRVSIEDSFGGEEEEMLRMKATRSGYRSSPRRAAVGRI